MKRIVSVTVFLFVMAALTTAQDVPKIINGGVLNGKAVSLPKPAYPEEAKKARFGGTVKVRVVIDENGNVVEAEATREVSENEPAETTALYNLLGEAAEKAAFEATFAPTRLSGQPVKVSGVITYNFMAKKARFGGTVKVRVVIDENGNVVEAEATREVSENEPAETTALYNLLGEAAEKAAFEATFAPTRLSGQPVKVSGVITYNFMAK